MAASADSQATATADAATAAKESASSAQAANDIAAKLQQVELARLHREMYPHITVDFQWEPSPRMPGQQNLFAYVHNKSEQDYELHPYAESGENSNSSNLTVVTVGAGQTTKIFVTNDGLLLPPHVGPRV